MLFFLLPPTILTPIYFLSPAGLVDYRKVWICLSALEWTCSVGVVYACLSAALSNFDGLLKILRKAWTLALVLGIGMTVLLTHVLPDSLASLTMDVLALNRAIVDVGWIRSDFACWTCALLLDSDPWKSCQGEYRHGHDLWR